MITELLETNAAELGDRPFILFEGEEISWSDTQALTARLAGLLEQRGIARGDRVILARSNSPTFIVSWFALRWMGAVCVPMHSAATPAAVASMVENAEIRTAIADADLFDALTTAVPHLADTTIRFDDYPALVSAVGNIPPVPRYPAGPADISSILYTSGTTGTPKGVTLAERTFTAGGRHLADAIGVTADDRILLALPLFHTNPQVYGVMVALNTGCSLAILSKFTPATLLNDAVAHRATGFTYVGALLHLVLSKSATIPQNHSLRFCVGGGASPDVWQEAESKLGLRVHELYGMTETGGWVSVARNESHHGTCGTARPDVDIAIVGEDDEVLPPGAVGQIVVRPREPHVLFSSYHGRPQTTLDRMGNLWFHTGDLGVLDDAKVLAFHGRADDVIRRGGENIVPSAVTDAVESHPGVLEAAAVGVPDDVMGQETKLVVVRRPGAEVTVDELTELMREHLPKFAHARYVEFRQELPRTATQKVQMQELRNLGQGVVDMRQETDRVKH